VRHRLLVLLLVAGCAEVRGLVTLRSSLSEEFPEAQVGVGLTDGLMLTVTLADSALVGAPCDRQVRLALRIARFARDHYEPFDSLQSVSVSYTRRSGRGAAATSSHLPFRFPMTAIRSGQLAADSANALALCQMDGSTP